MISKDIVIQLGLAGMLSQCRDVGLVGKYRKQVPKYSIFVTRRPPLMGAGLGIGGVAFSPRPALPTRKG